MQTTLAPRGGPHPSARSIRIVSTQRTVYDTSHCPLTGRHIWTWLSGHGSHDARPPHVVAAVSSLAVQAAASDFSMSIGQSVIWAECMVSADFLGWGEITGLSRGSVITELRASSCVTLCLTWKN